MAETIVPPRTYYWVYGTLLTLTLLTWGAFHLRLPHALALIVALTIAISKALLVVLFFMHVRYSRRKGLVPLPGPHPGVCRPH